MPLSTFDWGGRGRGRNRRLKGLCTPLGAGERHLYSTTSQKLSYVEHHDQPGQTDGFRSDCLWGGSLLLVGPPSFSSREAQCDGDGLYLLEAITYQEVIVEVG